ncbi:MAG: methyltransferase [Mycoplasmatales bacterium]
MTSVLLIFACTFLFVMIQTHEGKFDFRKIYKFKYGHRKKMMLELGIRIYLGYLFVLSINYHQVFGIINKITVFIILTLSLIIYVIAKNQLKENADNLEHEKTELVTTSIYSYTRNPMTISYYLVFVVFLLINYQIFWITILILLMLHHLLVIEEERELERRFGQQYINYKNKTKRYI